MRKFALMLVLLQLSACSQLCDCDNQQKTRSNQQQEPAADLADEMRQENTGPQVASSGLELVDDRTMQEAPPVASNTEKSQLDSLLASADTRPIPGLKVSSPMPLRRRALPSEQQQAMGMQFPSSPYPQLDQSKKQLADYAAQAAFKLAGFEALKGKKIGVASFVEFDDSLRNTTALGNQFAEAMVSLLPQYGVDVIEFKLTKGLSIGPVGDLSLSRDVRQLQKNVGMDYILTGTMVATRRGVQIHSRVVSVAQHRVIAATSTLIPHLVLQQIQP